ncbi:MAG: hypothetical protein EBR09_08935 [Proteobacteria bacterium]|nr:hypothetical protein [Pseudomonadota bacterium]
MKMTVKSVLAILPFSVLAACGTVKQASPVLTGDESALMGVADASDEADELVADHVEEVSSLLDLEDDAAGVSALGLAANKQKSLEKNCVVEAGKLTLSKQKTVEKDSDRTTRKGRVERQAAIESTYERVYSAAYGKELAVECKTAQGPVKIIKSKLAQIVGSSVEAKHSRSAERSLKLDGQIKSSRKVESEGTKTVNFGAATEQDGKLIVSKTVSFSASSTVNKLKDGASAEQKNSRKTIEEAPLKVEVVRDAASGALVHKLIQSGHVQIAHGEDRKVDIVYEQVKFTGECKPVSGRLLITKSKTAEAGNTANVLNIRFSENEIFLSRNGGEEKKIEELKLRLEDCGKTSQK